MAKLIILRGNSGSGKSTVARMLQDRATPPILLIDHDIVRLKMIKEKNRDKLINPGLILVMVKYGLAHDRHVIVEGNLQLHIYKDMLEQLNQIQPHDTYFYYFDIPLEVTLERHATKSEVDFNADDVRRWYKSKDEDATGFTNEQIIVHESTIDETVEQIMNETGLTDGNYQKFPHV